MLMRVIAVVHWSGNDDAIDFEVGLPNLKCARPEGERRAGPLGFGKQIRVIFYLQTFGLRRGIPQNANRIFLRRAGFVGASMRRQAPSATP